MPARGLERFDSLVFTSLWAGAAAFALTLAAGSILESEQSWPAATLALCGTVFVYNVDRIRDLERDRETAPIRSRFIEEHAARLQIVAGAAALAAAGLGAWLGPHAVALCAAVGALGLLHRRLKQRASFKTTYVTLSWVAITAGLPMLTSAAAPGPRAAVLVVFTLTLAANVIASNLRDREHSGEVEEGLRRAAALIGLAGVAGLLAPGTARALVALPIATGMALLPLPGQLRAQTQERYGLVVVDGALVAGGCAAALLAVL